MLNTLVLPYTKDDILDLAGQASYDRGVSYIDNVTELAFEGTKVSAAVQGTDEYEVTLTFDNGLDGYCDCPYGEEGNFCKHCVAVALIYLYHAEHGSLTTDATDPAGLADYLATLAHAELVDLLIEAAGRDAALRQRLELRAIGRAGTPLDVDEAIEQIEELLAVDGHVSYGEASGYADGVHDLIAWLTDLHDGGHDAATVSLVRYALQRLGQACGSIDDSDGHVGAAAEELAELHAQVCADTRPEPRELADWLLDFQTAGFDWPHLDIADYTDQLGEDGLARYGEQLTARWRALPDGNRSHSGYHIVHLMESWARARDDVDLLVAVLSTNQPYGIAYNRIVDVLTRAGRHAQALDWAERGIAGSQRADGSLVELVATRYAEAGRHADVLRLRREQLQRTRSVAAYQALRAAAEVVDDWPATRVWALDLLRPAGNAARGALPAWYGNVLVDVLLWEGETEAAWAAAHEHAATDPQWLRLAEARGSTHPQDAIPVYQRIIEKKVEARNNQSYAEAADLAVRVKALYATLDEPDASGQVTAYLARLRAAHKPKRNFIAELNRRGLP
ncbi:MAG TPA: SWIM zinc finger family protein [Micromonosporaceae bacterium]|nr:SWIM zinc finger family protein [Micromonosporaceae bacterium]